MDKKKSVLMLGFMSLLIIISGIMFSIYCYYANVKFMVMSNQIPGMVFGIVTVFLGIRYLRAVVKLRKVLAGSGEKFSWSNVRDVFGDLKLVRVLKGK